MVEQKGQITKCKRDLVAAVNQVAIAKERGSETEEISGMANLANIISNNSEVIELLVDMQKKK